MNLGKMYLKKSFIKNGNVSALMALFSVFYPTKISPSYDNDFLMYIGYSPFFHIETDPLRMGYTFYMPLFGKDENGYYLKGFDTIESPNRKRNAEILEKYRGELL
jgi:hypothetical protein